MVTRALKRNYDMRFGHVLALRSRSLSWAKDLWSSSQTRVAVELPRHLLPSLRQRVVQPLAQLGADGRCLRPLLPTCQGASLPRSQTKHWIELTFNFRICHVTVQTVIFPCIIYFKSAFSIPSNRLWRSFSWRHCTRAVSCMWCNHLRLSIYLGLHSRFCKTCKKVFNWFEYIWRYTLCSI